MARILVTGANGLVGSRLVRLLATKGHQVVGTGRGERRSGQAPGAYVTADLTDSIALAKVVEEATPDVIINCAAMTDVDGCERDRAGAWAANVNAVATLCHAANSLGAHLVHVSTDYVFDGDAGPYDVGAIPNPRGVYAESKYAGELAVRALANSWCIARTAVVFGWPAAGKNNFGSWVLSSLRDGKQIKLFDDQWVSPSLALNVAAMLAEIAEKKLNGIVHTSGADVVDRVTYGKAVAKLFGFDEGLIVASHMKDVKLASPRPVKSGLNVTQTAARLTDAKPLSLSDALTQFKREYEQEAAP